MAGTPACFPPIIAAVRTSASPKLTSSTPSLPIPPQPLLFAPASRISRGHARSAAVVCAKKALAREEKRELLERYGLDPDEFLSNSGPKTRRRKEETGTGRGRKRLEVDDDAAPVSPPRTTHKLLQVLGGKARRKKLLSPQGMDVRPMMEVVKGAAFAILQSAGGSPAALRPGRWLDLYSGTGSVGIEAISRGCSQVHFVEMDPWVVSDVLRPNLECTGFLEAATIHTVRVEDFFARAGQLAGSKGPFDYVSVTPPYTQVDYGVLMDQISKSVLIGEDSFILVEYPLGTDMLDFCGCLTKITDRRFGRTNLAIYGPQWVQRKRE
ncbi:hypothetical protein MLD38_001334 [Melastoma candidum]|uniref:Uncharacterized protein n=1 Tax=Melastoma candidum TaxID=119954 RepID=A0ACB9SCD4_9MYRT|nr:hypothetical protein MLD38_001334 [Melastoma candidum]